VNRAVRMYRDTNLNIHLDHRKVEENNTKKYDSRSLEILKKQFT
jgi:hypothetical protein